MKIKRHINLIFNIVLLVLLSCQIKKNKSYEYEYNDVIFGSYLRIKISASDSILVRNTINEIMSVLYRIDTIASIFNPTSEINRINKAGYGHMSPDFKSLILKSIEISDNTNGAFDITIGSVMKRFGFYHDSLATDSLLNTKKDWSVGYRNILIKGDSIFLNPNTLIDLGGITVGYVLDKIAEEILKTRALENVLIDIGGDIICYGNKTFLIGIRDPQNLGIIRTIRIKNQAISTSGNYEKYIERNGYKYTHLIDPKIQMPISDSSNNLSSVTIIADKATDADAYATAVFVLGLEAGQKLMRRLNLHGVLITNKGNVIEIL
ncbi:MAG: FAD:protein FMN transferase [candidate division WOR-3 bacterium]